MNFAGFVVKCLLLAILCSAVWSSAVAANTLIFPQFAGGVAESITFINSNFDAPVTGTLSIFNQDGSPRVVSIDGRSPAPAFQITAPPGGTVVLNMTPVGAVTIGMAKFTSDFPVGGVVRFQFGDAQVGVLPSPTQTFATVPVNTSDGNDTGLAIANPGPNPVNIRLVYADESGQRRETVDPPELNPLNPNGQVSRFLSQYGLTQVGNRSTGSVQIETKGAGTFSALALLLRNGLLSSTAIVPGVTGRIAPEQFQGSFSGVWKNNTFGSTGDASALVGVVPSAQAILFRLTLGGNVFGSPNAPPTIFYGTYDSNGYTATGDSVLFGPVTMTITPDGNWTMIANSVPGPTIATFRLTGAAHPDKFSGNYTVTFKGGLPPANGTITLSHTGQ